MEGREGCRGPGPAGGRRPGPDPCPLPSPSSVSSPLLLGNPPSPSSGPGRASPQMAGPCISRAPSRPWPPGPAFAPSGPSPQVPAQVHARPPGGPRLLLEGRGAEPGEETAAQGLQLHRHPSGQGDEPGAGAARGGRPAVAQEVLGVRVGARGV